MHHKRHSPCAAMECILSKVQDKTWHSNSYRQNTYAWLQAQGSFWALQYTHTALDVLSMHHSSWKRTIISGIFYCIYLKHCYYWKNTIHYKNISSSINLYSKNISLEKYKLKGNVCVWLYVSYTYACSECIFPMQWQLYLENDCNRISHSLSPH